MVARVPSPRSRRRSGTVVVIGSINMDLVSRVGRLPAPGETILGTDFRTVPGGKGANQAVAVARLGGRAIMIGRVGDDVFGQRLLRGLRDEGVDIRRVDTVAGTSSGVATIAVDDGGQNSIVVVPGANACLRPDDLRPHEALIADADVVLLQLEIPLPTVDFALRLASANGVPCILDTAPVPPGGLPPSRLGGRIAVLSPNQTEAMQLTGQSCDTPEVAASVGLELARRYDADNVVMKLGSLGAVSVAEIDGGPEFLRQRAFPVKPVDTTAAGDAFMAGLSVLLAEGASLREALPFAAAAGALATTRPGAQEAMPTRTAVERLLRRHRLRPVRWPSAKD